MQNILPRPGSQVVQRQLRIGQIGEINARLMGLIRIYHPISLRGILKNHRKEMSCYGCQEGIIEQAV